MLYAHATFLPMVAGTKYLEVSQKQNKDLSNNMQRNPPPQRFFFVDEVMSRTEVEWRTLGYGYTSYLAILFSQHRMTTTSVSALIHTINLNQKAPAFVEGIY